MILLRKFSVRTFGMLLCAYVWILIGVGAFKEISIPYPGVFHLMIPGNVRGGIWLGTAAVAITFAWSRRLSPAALGLLWFMPTLQMISYGTAWLLYQIDGGNPGYQNGWYSAALYLALIGMVIMAALVPSRAMGLPPLNPKPRPSAVST